MIKHLMMAAVLVMSGSAFAKMGPDLTVQDRQFIEKVASANMAEIKLARLAEERSESPVVKKYARMIVDDHTKAGQKLRSIASTESFPEPTSMDTAHQAAYDKLATLSGKEFDEHFMKMMVKDHDQTISDFEKAADQVSYPPLKKFASETLPTLRVHEHDAKIDRPKIKEEK